MTIWTYSDAREIKKCQRRWYFGSILASGRAHDPKRRRAFFYSKLDSIDAWRGRIVDTVISRHIVPAWFDDDPDLKWSLRIARRLFDSQLSFARTNRAATVDVKLGDVGEAFALLTDFEFADGPSNEALDKAWQDMEAALVYFWSHEPLQELLEKAEFLISQPRILHFSFGDGAKGKASPDLLLFQHGKAPTIVDWKVHAEGGNDAADQLATYAIALSRCKAHSDFPEPIKHEPEAMNLIEAQLLLQRLKHYQLDTEAVSDMEAEMMRSAYEMEALVDNGDFSNLSPKDFATARDPSTCESCCFKKPCCEAVQ